jgi:iron-sulfur cluster insertion protein
MNRLPITITKNAWSKINTIINKTNNKYGMIFGASSGGCNGFNYELTLLEKEMYDSIKSKNPSILYSNSNSNSNSKLYIDPQVEMYLLGTTIDYSENIYENKFTFTPDKSFANTCGCGSSFTVL